MNRRISNITTIACYALTFLATQANLIVVFMSDLTTTSMLCASAGIFVITSALITILGALDVLIPHLASPRVKGTSSPDASLNLGASDDLSRSSLVTTPKAVSSNPMPFESELPGVVY